MAGPGRIKRQELHPDLLAELDKKVNKDSTTPMTGNQTVGNVEIVGDNKVLVGRNFTGVNVNYDTDHVFLGMEKSFDSDSSNAFLMFGDNAADLMKIYHRDSGADKLTQVAKIDRTSVEFRTAVTNGAYRTLGLGGTVTGEWSPVATVTITGQYAVVVALIDCVMGENGGYNWGMGKVFFRVKQQSAMGQAPIVQVVGQFGGDLTHSQFMAVTTSNTSAQTVVTLYFKTMVTYDGLQFTPVVVDGTQHFTAHDQATRVSSLPAGTQTQCQIYRTAEEARIAVTFTNGWLNFDGTWSNCFYWKDSNNIVHLNGLMKAGTLDATAFTLPAGYRLATQEIFNTRSGNGTARVDVMASGIVVPKSEGGATNTWISLSGIKFKAEQ